MNDWQHFSIEGMTVGIWKYRLVLHWQQLYLQADDFSNEKEQSHLNCRSLYTETSCQYTMTTWFILSHKFSKHRINSMLIISNIFKIFKHRKKYVDFKMWHTPSIETYLSSARCFQSYFQFLFLFEMIS